MIGGETRRGLTETLAVLGLGIVAFTPRSAMTTPRYGCAVAALSGDSRALVVGGHSGTGDLPQVKGWDESDP